MLRGDSHRLYVRLRRKHPTAPQQPLPELDHVRAIAAYYNGLHPDERRLLFAWAKKEESGIGLIPAALSGIPVLGLVFAPFFQQTIKRLAPWVWFTLWIMGAVAFTAGIYIHFRQKAWTTLHVHLLEQLCADVPSCEVTADLEPPHAGLEGAVTEPFH